MNQTFNGSTNRKLKSRSNIFATFTFYLGNKAIAIYNPWDLLSQISWLPPSELCDRSVRMVVTWRTGTIFPVMNWHSLNFYLSGSTSGHRSFCQKRSWLPHFCMATFRQFHCLSNWSDRWKSILRIRINSSSFKVVEVYSRWLILLLIMTNKLSNSMK